MVKNFPYKDQLSQYYDVESSWLHPRPLPPPTADQSKRLAPETAAFDLLMALFAFAIVTVLVITCPTDPGCIIPLLVVYYAGAGLHLLLKAYHLWNQRR